MLGEGQSHEKDSLARDFREGMRIRKK